MDAAVAADRGALKKYESVDALLDPVRRGPRAPLSGRYLVELSEGWRVRPWVFGLAPRVLSFDCLTA